ncbi:hypothetical protein BKH46_05060 [Helicobacter sp. 12S02634-8]|uniref:DUF1561 family protein n=1 Tax=Helicobacter sp. 12S02634-8 TaxID=1476199 RepID=UPI000BA69248|nr:DUF1561 family protein [Helicobacter sp. 12S02634-8]PAF47089.1 hypothetical protein BKH46_05060 [Helicobacter sp. 12S02634-8]
MKILILAFLASAYLLHAAPAQVPQKLTDTPIDKAIRVKVDGAEYCYAPVFTQGEGYIYIDDCKSVNVKFARYDVFERVAFHIDNNWLCMTAPKSVTGIGEVSSQPWDYVTLRPCVINDANQRWTIKDNAFYAANGKFRLKHYKWYAYISKNPSDYYDHTLDSSMATWIKTIATPGNISSVTSLGWLFAQTGAAPQTYYIQNNKSTTTPTDLYYNPENGHIAQYYPNSGSLYCMQSNTTPSQDWNWVSWEYCDDGLTQNADNKSWDISIQTDVQGVIKDVGGNILRLTQYGPNWGVPYSAKSAYLEGDTTNTPLSLFIFDQDIRNWNRYVNANLGDNLHFCPAPGDQEETNKPQKRFKRDLPSSFRLDEAWLRRLWQIAISNTPQGQTVIGMCGVCLLHSLQMVAELQENAGIRPALSAGGYFFDTADGVDPFVSFQQRFPELAARVALTTSLAGVPLRPGETQGTRVRRVTWSISLALLPQYRWILSQAATTQAQFESNINNLLQAPVGAVWLVAIVRSNAQGSGRVGHAQVILRTQDGLVLVPTNVPQTPFDVFRAQLDATTSATEILSRITLGNTRTLFSLSTLRLIQSDENPIQFTMSQNNCTGEGSDRRGSSHFPRSNLVNQCLSGRCLLQ